VCYLHTLGFVPYSNLERYHSHSFINKYCYKVISAKYVNINKLKCIKESFWFLILCLWYYHTGRLKVLLQLTQFARIFRLFSLI